MDTCPIVYSKHFILVKVTADPDFILVTLYMMLEYTLDWWQPSTGHPALHIHSLPNNWHVFEKLEKKLNWKRV